MGAWNNPAEDALDDDRDKIEGFEAYTPVAKRKRGYYALPLLWRDSVIGWANVTTPTLLSNSTWRVNDTLSSWRAWRRADLR